MFDLGDHVTTTESAIGAIAGLFVWIVVIAYFCFCRRRPISNRDKVLRKFLKAAARETLKEDKLAKIYYTRSAPSLRKSSLELETRRTDYKKFGRWNQKLEPVWDEKDIERWSDDVSSSTSVGVLADISTRNFYATDVQLGLVVPAGLDEESSAIYVSSKNEEFNEKENEAKYKESIAHHKCIGITKKRLQLTVQT